MALTRLGTNAITSVPSSAITALPAGVGGKVLQVVTSSYSTTMSTTSSSLVTTNLSANITPSSASNKIMVFVYMPTQLGGDGGTDNGGTVTVYRDSTNISNTAYNFYAYTGSGSAESASPFSFSTLDSPNSTSTLNYNVKYKSDYGGSFYVHKDNSVSYITLMEIAG